jgi:hypothetical protein
MDDNKRIKLKEIGYTINGCCGLCTHSFFRHGSDWGDCQKFDYDHKKHTATSKPLSIHRYGSCPEFVGAVSDIAQLAGFEEFYG